MKNESAVPTDVLPHKTAERTEPGAADGTGEPGAVESTAAREVGEGTLVPDPTTIPSGSGYGLASDAAAYSSLAALDEAVLPHRDLAELASRLRYGGDVHLVYTCPRGRCVECS